MIDIDHLTESGFRGNVLIVKNGAVLCEYSSGYADLPNQIYNTADTRFATASVGKTFVAAGILKLIECGKLDFNDTLGNVLDIDLNFNLELLSKLENRN